MRNTKLRHMLAYAAISLFPISIALTIILALHGLLRTPRVAQSRTIGASGGTNLVYLKIGDVIVLQSTGATGVVAGIRGSAIVELK